MPDDARHTVDEGPVLRIAILDFMGMGYSVDTAYSRPIGGTQSATCYLAEEMARLGCAVTLYNGIAEPTRDRGVAARPIAELFRTGVSDLDVVVVSGGCSAGFVTLWQDTPAPRPFLVYWTGHMSDQPTAAMLADADFRALWDGFVFVSRFQADAYAAAFGVPADRSTILPYAIAPAFEASARVGAPPLSARFAAPILAYTSTPFRGLDVLLGAFPRIRESVPDVRLRIYSSMALYQVPDDQDPFGVFYAQARRTEGVEYVGPLPQPRLAEAMREVCALAYPNTFEETFCIAAYEALSAGCFVASSDLGALPETLGGFGILMKPEADKRIHAEHFAQMMVWLLTNGRDNPESFDAHQRRQIDHVLSNGVWSIRAQQWLDWLAQAMPQAVPHP